MPLPQVGLGSRAFRLPRQGYGWEECQDALAGDAEHGRFAIADGAAESPYSALWAHLLVEEFVRRTEHLPNWADWLPSLQERWSAQVTVYERWAAHSARPANGDIQTTEAEDLSVPWYLEAGLLQGAFATFLGLVIEEHRWYAAAVGDSCLFQVRQDELIHAFPVTRAADFSNAPWLVGSRTSPFEVPHKNGLQQMGDCQPRDRIWLMTDALAQWFLLESESGGKPWLTLEPLLYAADDDSAQHAFAYWIEGLRSTRQLRNDDVTLLALSF
ncbi:MAG: protein phosphatase 2C domain-containing protein [Gemmataceae bacterium]